MILLHRGFSLQTANIALVTEDVCRQTYCHGKANKMTLSTSTWSLDYRVNLSQVLLWDGHLNSLWRLLAQHLHLLHNLSQDRGRKIFACTHRYFINVNYF